MCLQHDPVCATNPNRTRTPLRASLLRPHGGGNAAPSSCRGVGLQEVLIPSRSGCMDL